MNTATANRIAVGPLPKPSPVRLAGLLIQSANEAPSGRVTTYAIQNAAMLLSPNRRQASAGKRITTKKNRPDTRYPIPSESAVKSPSAVPSANVANTVAQ